MTGPTPDLQPLIAARKTGASVWMPSAALTRGEMVFTASGLAQLIHRLNLALAQIEVAAPPAPSGAAAQPEASGHLKI